MKNVFKLGCVASLLALSPSVLAQTQSQGLSYNYVELSLGSSEIEAGNRDVDGDIFAGEISYELSDVIYVGAGFTMGDFDSGVDQNQFEIGIGGHTALSNVTDLYGGLSYLDAEIEMGNFSVDDTGYGLEVGLKHMLTDRILLNGEIGYVDLFNDDSTGIKLGARYYFVDNFSAGVSYSDSDDVSALTISARLNF